ncbi:Cytochrome P450 94A1 [Escovopsis weberi]|uniref:Cytochrome P450 94A1 n=1 Tax=Escovopsis weberi TaxID=150374 RepID=A0A0M9VVW3_ESCWE|nr:Cytochrome P450 94A1 [Escovopsis weberi]
MSADLDQVIEGSSDGVLDIQEFFNKVTLEIAGLAIMGERLGKLRSRDKGLTFEQCYTRILSPDPIGIAITFLQVWIPLRWLPIKANRDHFEADREIRSMIMDLIEKRRAEALADDKAGGNVSSRRDVLSKTVAANLNDKFISDQELMDILVQFIIAGHETIARALAWLMSELVRHPEVVARLRQEIAEARAKQPVLDRLTVEGLPYLHNVIRESLRLYTTATMVSWEAIQNVVVEGVVIPKGTLVHLVPRLMNRKHAVWGKDADEFNPDRWDHLNEYSGDAFAFQTFLNGPRICPGVPLVMLEMRVLCLELVEKFNFELADPNKVITDCHPSISLKIKDGLPLRFQRRAAE